MTRREEYNTFMKLNRDDSLWYKYVLRMCSPGRRKPLLKQNDGSKYNIAEQRRSI